jgi:hypothetical protein
MFTIDSIIQSTPQFNLAEVNETMPLVPYKDSILSNSIELYYSDSDSAPESESNDESDIEVDIPQSPKRRTTEATRDERRAIEVEKLKGNQVKHAGFVFNRKRVLKRSGVIVYKCKGVLRYNCLCELRYYPESESWTSLESHEHPSELSEKQKINPCRLDYLRDWIRQHPDEFNVKNIAYAVNSTLTTADKLYASEFLSDRVIRQIRKEFYTPRITCIQQLANREELSKTLDGQNWLRCLHVAPTFMIIYASTYAINEVNKMDLNACQWYIDGTFDVAPEGVEQVVTLLVRQPNETRPYPVVHILLQKKDQHTYTKMWKKIIKLMPKIRKINKMYITLDFEDAMHAAIAEILPNTRRLGCWFHLKKTHLVEQ